MRVLPTIFLASGALAAVVPQNVDPNSPEWDCILSNWHEMAADADCGDYPLLAQCFSTLSSSSPDALAECYAQAGCSVDDSFRKSDKAHGRCVELFGNGELRRRSHDHLMPRATPPPRFGEAAVFDGMHIVPRTVLHGDQCFELKTIDAETCDMETVNGITRTKTCYPTKSAISVCAAGMTCTRDSGGDARCMNRRDNLSIGGIIVTIVFGVGIVAGIAAITFLCCQDRKENKRLTAKAEATALARAATKKKRAAERGPRAAAGVGAGDPFHDSNRS